MRWTGWIVVMVVLLLGAGAGASEFRALNEISSPRGNADLGTGAGTQVTEPVDRGLIEEAVRELLAAWNTGELDEWLADDFYDRWRLLDVIDEEVPMDAEIRVLAFEDVRTLSQSVEADPQGLPVDYIISLVSATVRTQIEYNDPGEGFQRIEGTNRFIFRVTQKRLQGE